MKTRFLIPRLIGAIAMGCAAGSASAASPALVQGAPICFDQASGLSLDYQIDFSAQAKDKKFDLYVAAHHSGVWAFLGEDGRWSIYAADAKAPPPMAHRNVVHPARESAAASGRILHVGNTGLMGPKVLPGLQLVAGFGESGDNSFAELLARGQFGLIGTVSGTEPFSGSCRFTLAEVSQQIGGGTLHSVEGVAPLGVPAAPVPGGAGGAGGAPTSPSTGTGSGAGPAAPPPPVVPPAKGTLEMGHFPQDLNLSSVERLSKSARYRLDVRKSGASAFSQNYVFETKNDWVVYDFFNADPQRRMDVRRSASQFGDGKSDQKSFAFTRFSFSDTSVDVKVSLPPDSEKIATATIRPLRHGIKPVISEDRRSLTFTLDQPMKVSVEINDRNDPLFVLADLPDTPGRPSSYTYHFGPGVHRLPGNGTLVLRSNETVYIAAGAIVEGRFVLATGSDGIQITGRGILSRGEWNHTSTSVEFLTRNATFYSEGTSNFLLEGLTVVNSNAWQVALNDYSRGGNANVNNRYLNLNLLSWNGNTDAFWVTGLNTRVENAFVFNNDDLIVSKGGVGARVDNVVHWSGVWGRSLLLHPILNNMPNISDLQMGNIDVIGKEGGTTMLHFEQDDKSLKRVPSNIRIFNFRAEERRRPGNSNNNSYNAQRFISFKDDKGKGSFVKELSFDNVTLDQTLNDEGYLQGTAQEPATGIRFKNFRRGGVQVLSPQASGIGFSNTAAPQFRP